MASQGDSNWALCLGVMVRIDTTKVKAEPWVPFNLKNHSIY